jgi:hypothetical protein
MEDVVFKVTIQLCDEDEPIVVRMLENDFIEFQKNVEKDKFVQFDPTSNHWFNADAIKEFYLG